MIFSKKVLKNGLRIITIPMKDNPTVTVLVMVEAGSKYETKKLTGISHFIEHTLFKGTTKRPTAMDISRELDSIGSHYNAFTSQEFTGYYAKAQAKHFSDILDVISDLYLNPLFDPAEIEKEKGVIVEEINMYEDLPHRQVQDLFGKLLYGDQPAGWSVTGTRETVRAMNRDDFMKYRSKHYVASATTVIVAGDITETKAVASIEKAFKSIPADKKEQKLKVKESQTKPEILVQYKKTDQAHLVLGFRTFDIHDKRIPALRVIQSILSGGMSSRLFQKLREEMGIGYYVRASEESSTDHGVFQISAGVDTKRVPEAIKAILNECKRLCVEKVSVAELKKVNDYMDGSMLLGLESSDSLAEFLGYQEVMRRPLQTPAKISKEISCVTPEDIQKLAKTIFQDKNLNLAIIGPYEKAAEFKPLLTLK